MRSKIIHFWLFEQIWTEKDEGEERVEVVKSEKEIRFSLQGQVDRGK